MPKATEQFALNDEQKKAIAALAKCSFLPASFDKRFARDISNQERVTRKQYECIKNLLYKYRVQLFGKAAQKGDRARLTIESWFPRLPDAGSVVLGGGAIQPGLRDVVLGGDR